MSLFIFFLLVWSADDFSARYRRERGEKSDNGTHSRPQSSDPTEIELWLSKQQFLPVKSSERPQSSVNSDSNKKSLGKLSKLFTYSSKKSGNDKNPTTFPKHQSQREQSLSLNRNEETQEKSKSKIVSFNKPKALKKASNLLSKMKSMPLSATNSFLMKSNLSLDKLSLKMSSEDLSKSQKKVVPKSPTASQTSLNSITSIVATIHEKNVPESKELQPFEELSAEPKNSLKKNMKKVFKSLKTLKKPQKGASNDQKEDSQAVSKNIFAENVSLDDLSSEHKPSDDQIKDSQTVVDFILAENVPLDDSSDEWPSEPSDDQKEDSQAVSETIIAEYVSLDDLSSEHKPSKDQIKDLQAVVNFISAEDVPLDDSSDEWPSEPSDDQIKDSQAVSETIIAENVSFDDLSEPKLSDDQKEDSQAISEATIAENVSSYDFPSEHKPSDDQIKDSQAVSVTIIAENVSLDDLSEPKLSEDQIKDSQAVSETIIAEYVSLDDLSSEPKPSDDQIKDSQAVVNFISAENVPLNDSSDEWPSEPSDDQKEDSQAVSETIIAENVSLDDFPSEQKPSDDQIKDLLQVVSETIIAENVSFDDLSEPKLSEDQIKDLQEISNIVSAENLPSDPKSLDDQIKDSQTVVNFILAQDVSLDDASHDCGSKPLNNKTSENMSDVACIPQKDVNMYKNINYEQKDDLLANITLNKTSNVRSELDTSYLIIILEIFKNISSMKEYIMEISTNASSLEAHLKKCLVEMNTFSNQEQLTQELKECSAHINREIMNVKGDDDLDVLTLILLDEMMEHFKLYQNQIIKKPPFQIIVLDGQKCKNCCQGFFNHVSQLKKAAFYTPFDTKKSLQDQLTDKMVHSTKLYLNSKFVHHCDLPECEDGEDLLSLYKCPLLIVNMSCLNSDSEDDTPFPFPIDQHLIFKTNDQLSYKLVACLIKMSDGFKAMVFQDGIWYLKNQTESEHIENMYEWLKQQTKNIKICFYEQI
ncbi:hypothetical protein M153_13000012635 [Pseudoloma neurophilia]|uniref:Uncharacterized protein n=1 Tax=Pseudoloma neurophilia TaxID=146866 RepID=A0A0R0M6V9_9MICR|nr:hypothetical protein M153_13000012635 [Pseudoloma neurophilia]